ncbi:MAG: hypothetical protein HC804_15015 [Anaerolineae bacterium]|nr:hypothetical protein [Anaerolineae bacterium]
MGWVMAAGFGVLRRAGLSGQEVALGTYEGTDENGTGFRQILGVFEAKSGSPAMLMIMGPSDNWDEGGISQFIDSLE